jgi:hypothetical protein
MSQLANLDARDKTNTNGLHFSSNPPNPNPNPCPNPNAGPQFSGSEPKNISMKVTDSNYKFIPRAIKNDFYQVPDPKMIDTFRN